MVDLLTNIWYLLNLRLATRDVVRSVELFKLWLSMRLPCRVVFIDVCSVELFQLLRLLMCPSPRCGQLPASLQCLYSVWKKSGYP